VRFKVFHHEKLSKLCFSRVPLPGLSTRWSRLTPQATVDMTFHSARSRSTRLQRGARPQREDFGSPQATQVGGYLAGVSPRYLCKQGYLAIGHSASRASHGVLGSFQRHQGRSAARACCQLRTPGFASPGTFPSQRFSRPQGFTPPNSAEALSSMQPYFMPQPLIGFPSLV
jgi:hypothetical protein